MRLTADIILRAEHYLNSWKEREINLRGLKIPTIENLAILQDQFDCIDISDNEIRKLSNFPSMTRLNTILACNNHISRIDKLGSNLLGLTSLVLTNNRINDLSEIDNIATLMKLEHLCLLDNPVILKANYRLYVIHRLPALKSLDFHKVQQPERDAARKYFKSVVGKAMLSDITRESQSADAQEQGLSESAQKVPVPTASKPPVVLTEEQKQLVREAIQGAKTKEEIDVIERKLKDGTFFELFDESETNNSA